MNTMKQATSRKHFFTYTTRAAVKLERFEQIQTEITRANRRKEEIGKFARAEDRKVQRSNAHVLVYVIGN